MRLFDEFKAFVQRGNVLDLAVAVVMGTAFGKIVNSLVTDIAMPLIGIATQEREPGDPTIRSSRSAGPGKNLGSAEIWIVSPGEHRLRDHFDLRVFGGKSRQHDLQITAAHASGAPTPQEKLLMEIRDLLKANQTPPAQAAPPPVP